MRDPWDLDGDGVSAVDTDPRTHETRVRITSGAEVVVRNTRAIRCPTPLPTGEAARILNTSRVTTAEAGIFTLLLGSGDTLQIAGSGLILRLAS